MIQLDSATAVATFLDRHGWRLSEPWSVEELSGGVSCRVLRARTDEGDVVVKQALSELRVDGPWRADVARAEVEFRFAQVLTELVPGACPVVLATDPEAHAFVMDAVADAVSWKQELLTGRVDTGVAESVGRLLGLLHARAADRPDLRDEFADRTNFRSLRLEPYFQGAATAHPDLADRIGQVAADLDGPGVTLVHGDVSPKNILLDGARKVLLIDHEVAHWGRPAFDTAFVVNHLCLKAVHRPDRAEAHLRAAESLLAAYTDAAGAAAATDADTARVLGPLLLARVDGRSPVEYLSDEQRDRVRHLARDVLVASPDLGAHLRRVHDAASRTPGPPRSPASSRPRDAR